MSIRSNLKHRLRVFSTRGFGTEGVDAIDLPEPEPEQEGELVDLIAALRESVKETQKKRKPAKRRARKAS